MKKLAFRGITCDARRKGVVTEHVLRREAGGGGKRQDGGWHADLQIIRKKIRWGNRD